MPLNLKFLGAPPQLSQLTMMKHLNTFCNKENVGNVWRVSLRLFSPVLPVYLPSLLQLRLLKHVFFTVSSPAHCISKFTMSYAQGPSTHGPIYITGQPPPHCFINTEDKNAAIAMTPDLPNQKYDPTHRRKQVHISGLSEELSSQLLAGHARQHPCHGINFNSVALGIRLLVGIGIYTSLRMAFVALLGASDIRIQIIARGRHQLV